MKIDDHASENNRGHKKAWAATLAAIMDKKSRKMKAPRGRTLSLYSVLSAEGQRTIYSAPVTPYLFHSGQQTHSPWRMKGFPSMESTRTRSGCDGSLAHARQTNEACQRGSRSETGTRTDLQRGRVVGKIAAKN